MFVIRGERAGRGPLVLSCSEGRRGRPAGGAARWLGGPATAKGSAPKPAGGQIFQASHAARKLGRNIRLVTRNNVVGSLGPDGRLKFLSAPAISSERLSRLPDGRVRYALKTPYRDGTTQMIFEPLDLLARLAALVPSPGVNLTPPPPPPPATMASSPRITAGGR